MYPKEVVWDTELGYSGRYHLLEDLCHGSGGRVFDRDPARRDLLTTLAIEHDGPISTQGNREAQAGGEGDQQARAGRM